MSPKAMYISGMLGMPVAARLPALPPAPHIVQMQ